MSKRILITGNEGYIGSQMVPVFLESGYEVTGLDTGYFRDCTLTSSSPQVHTLQKDIRDLVPSDLEGFDGVVHLAALSNDPVGNLNPQWTSEINLQGSVQLAQAAKSAGVERFLFSSSCIMYGMSETAVVNEESPLDPRTDYARSKVLAEQAIGDLAGDGFSPSFLRNGTVYGASSRMRFDTVLNDLVGNATVNGEIVLYSDGTPWRPVVHVQDVAQAFRTVLEAPLDAVHNQAFNTGADHLNLQIIQLAEIVADSVPGCQIRVLAEPGADQRTYKASFEKFASTFPDFRFNWSAEEGAKDLYQTLSELGLTNQQFTSPQFTRLKWLNTLLDAGHLDSTLRWPD